MCVRVIDSKRGLSPYPKLSILHALGFFLVSMFSGSPLISALSNVETVHLVTGLPPGLDKHWRGEVGREVFITVRFLLQPTVSDLRGSYQKHRLLTTNRDTSKASRVMHEPSRCSEMQILFLKHTSNYRRSEARRHFFCRLLPRVRPPSQAVFRGRGRRKGRGKRNRECNRKDNQEQSKKKGESAGEEEKRAGEEDK